MVALQSRCAHRNRRGDCLSLCAHFVPDAEGIVGGFLGGSAFSTATHPRRKPRPVTSVLWLGTTALPRRHRSGYLLHHVLASVRVGHAYGAFRIIAPVAVHNEAIVMLTRRQFHAGAPYPVLAFAHGNAFLLPLGEVAHQGDARSCRGGETEGLF